ncbi:MAG TPA: alpha/beta hydrolase [Ktedonobacteraceae bacterium]|nr:alpha/beta hydrolase [Ktedonobacteraceae bacterium]
MNNPLVFIHGAGDSARVWKKQTAYFGTRAHAIDLPGHGARPDTLPEQVSALDYARAVRKIMQDELHLVKPVVVGHSLGGLITLELGLEYGQELAGLVLLGTGARMRVLPALLEAARSEPEQALRQLRTLSIADQTDPQLSTRLANEQTQPQPGMLYRDLLACNSFDVMGRLQEIAALPTLIICGAEERNAPVKYSTYLHEHIAGSILKIIPAAGHYVQREKPEEVNRAIAEWLEGI